MNKLEAVPITLREANDFVESFHRHNGRTARNGGKFAIGVSDSKNLIGVAIVGRPLARLLQDGVTAEVLRCCVVPNAQKGACSFLYARCWNAWRSMGGKRIITYTLQTESGVSLKGAGFSVLHESKPSKNGWNRKSRGRDWQAIYGQSKFCWSAQA